MHANIPKKVENADLRVARIAICGKDSSLWIERGEGPGARPEGLQGGGQGLGAGEQDEDHGVPPLAGGKAARGQRA